MYKSKRMLKSRLLHRNGHMYKEVPLYTYRRVRNRIFHIINLSKIIFGQVCVETSRKSHFKGRFSRRKL